jgi:hypothetical protein
MPVFISHKREDTKQAEAIKNYLSFYKIECYIDVTDPLIQTTDDLTALLMKRVKACTHLMAVVSTYTTQSWWVPFEIGVASELEKRITSYRLNYVLLPDFISKWPVLSTQQDLDTFIRYYQMDSLVSNRERMFKAATILTANEFHRTMKNALHQ